jgi:peptidoglycan/xylan/chitin deacetylase (PgdA/CDA1 family)
MARALLCGLILALVLDAGEIGVPPRILPAAAQDRGIHVPILVYHAVDDSGLTYSVTPQQLDAQCRWLVAHGYTTITLRQFWQAARGRAELPPHPVLLTDDDGGPSALIFARILARHGLAGTYFVNNVSPLTSRQIRALARRGTVEAHTFSHVALSTLSYPDQLAEISRNVGYLEQVTGRPVRFLAWPYGDFDARAIHAARAAGVVAAFALGGAPADLAAIDRYVITRITIYVDDDLASFAAKVSGD